MKEQITQDILSVNEKYKEEFPNMPPFLNRDYYRKNGKFKESQINKEFGSFEVAKETAFKNMKEEMDLISYKKKILVLEEKARDLEKENTDLLKNTILEEEIINAYKDKLEKGVCVKLNKSIQLTEIKETSKREALLFLSDWHLGEVVLPEEVNYVNEFNSDIMVKRLDRVFEYFIHYCNMFKVKNVHLIFAGDLLSGSIHPELLRTSEMNEVDGLFFLQEYITKKILEIESHFNTITCEFVVGNHSRIAVGTNVKPEYKTAGRMNWEYILSRQLELYFNMLQKDKKHKKIIVNTNDSLFKIITVGGRNFLVTHGQILCGGGSGGFAGIPIYSLAMSSAKLFGALQQVGFVDEDRVDDIMIGHLHTTGSFTMFNGGKFFLNGCIVGTSEFSLYKIRSVAKIEQTMLIVEDGEVVTDLVLRGEDSIKKKK